MARRILSVCYEECLPPSVIEFLEAAGCEMTCIREPGAALQRFESAPFDLILINQTVSSSQEHLLVEQVRRMSSIPIIFVSGTPELTPTDVNICLHTPIRPEDLLRAITDLVPYAYHSRRD